VSAVSVRWWTQRGAGHRGHRIVEGKKIFKKNLAATRAAVENC
jgi:hypothetical protein